MPVRVLVRRDVRSTYGVGVEQEVAVADVVVDLLRLVGDLTDFAAGAPGYRVVGPRPSSSMASWSRGVISTVMPSVVRCSAASSAQ